VLVGGGLLAIYLHSKKASSSSYGTTTTTTTGSSTLPGAVGGTVVLTDGAQTINTTSGTPFVVGLPSGGTWVSLVSAKLNGASLLGTIPAGSAQPVTVMSVIDDVITGVYALNGVQHTGTINISATLPKLTG
jgi:hypothetical protein